MTNLTFPPTTYIAQTPAPPPGDAISFSLPPWADKAFMGSTGILAIALVVASIRHKVQLEHLKRDLKLERYKTSDVKKKLNLALSTIKKMEKNPDLVHSRDFNLDYLRMRMEEEVFHYAIVNQVKVRIKQIMTVALRPNTAETTVGVGNSNGRKIDEIFDIHYETRNSSGKRIKGVLFRIQVQLTKLPTQSTSSTVQEMIDCIENYLNPTDENSTWQPAIQGRMAVMEWDQKAKPTPLLVLRQTEEGGNVSFRTNVAKAPVSSNNMTTVASRRPKATPRKPTAAQRPPARKRPPTR